MRKPIMAGNWKMHKTVSEAKALAEAIKQGAADVSEVEVVLCPPYTALDAVSNVLAGTNIKAGAQNMCQAEEGAVTGEISPLMVKELAQYVILGHSERRQYFAESDEGVNNKVKAALKHGLIPIICVGENLEQNKAGETVEFVGGQVRGALNDLNAEQVAQLIIAYEPVWAIGTGLAAEPEAVNQIIKESIRNVVAQQFGEDAAQALRVQYGGSVKPANVAGFMAQSEIDGALVGGASLKADSFLALVKAAKLGK